MHSLLLSVSAIFLAATCPMPTAAFGFCCYLALILYSAFCMRESFRNANSEPRVSRAPRVAVQMHERTAHCDALFWEVARSFVPDGPRKDAESAAYELVFNKGMAAGKSAAPECVLYLRVSPEECLRRKDQRGRTCEEGVTELTYLQKLGAAHDVMYGPESMLPGAITALADLVSPDAAEAVLRRRAGFHAGLAEPMLHSVEEFEARVVHAVERRTPLRCAVVGNIAAGKSTLIRSLQARLGDSVKQVQEPVDDWAPLLDFYNREPAEGAFPIQMCALQTRLLDWSK